MTNIKKKCKHGHSRKLYTITRHSGGIICLLCKRLANRKDHNKHKVRVKLQSRIYKLRVKYNLTLEQFNKILLLQDKKCALCLRTFTKSIKYRCEIDHDHKTGKVRKLLCHKCNSGIGYFKDDVIIFKKIVNYLEEHNE